MSGTPRLVGIIATLAIHAGVAWLVLRPAAHAPILRDPPPTNTLTAQVATRPAGRRSVPPVQAPVQPASASSTAPIAEFSVFSLQDPALRLAYDAGAEYRRRRDDAQYRDQRDTLGPEIAAAMRLPIADAWGLLEPLALAGDQLAAGALVMLAGECLPAPEGENVHFVADLQSRMIAEDAAFHAGATEADALRRSERFAMCETHGLGPARLKALVESHGGRIESGRMGLEWIDIFDAFTRQFGTDEIEPLATGDTTAAAIRLSTQGSEPASEDLERVIEASATDAAAANFLSACFVNGCEHIPALPESERLAWSLRASRLGTDVALSDLVRITEAQGDRLSALAWAGYRRWVSIQGCDMSSYLMGMETPAIEYARLLSVSTPAEASQAQRLTSEFVARYGADARRFLGCAN